MMGRFAILCVDDEEIILRSLESQLEDAFGHYCEIELAQSAEEGLEIIDEFVEAGVEIVVIISDWLMPGMKGDEFLIQAHGLCPGIEKIMLSGHADEGAIKNARERQALDCFVHKPWDNAKLLDLIAVAMRKHGCMVPKR
jgi:DNA-binding NtrC family response regulator